MPKKTRSKKTKQEPHKWHIPAFLLTSALVTLVFGYLGEPRKTEALGVPDTLLSHFGGKVEYWTPQSSDPGCTAITAAISVATLGAVNITFEEIKIGEPKEATAGIVKINGTQIPGLPQIYKHNKHQLIGTNVIGSSLNICDACNKTGNSKNPAVKKICGTKHISKLTDKVCKGASSACSPLSNLLYQIGSGNGPSL